MRTRNGWLALLLTVGWALAPTAVWGQQISYEVPQSDPAFPFPLYSPRPELGGFFFNGEFLYWRQSNPLRSQTVAQLGFVDSDGSITAPSPAGPFRPGTFVGSGLEALNVSQVSGPGTYVPGYRMALGYRFRNGVAAEVIYTHLFNARFSAGATLVPRMNFFPFPNQLDPQLANTVLFSPVYAFPADFAGPVGSDLGVGNPQAPFGIWNAADEMLLKFEQRLDRWELRFRVPIWETDYDPIHDDKRGHRVYGMTGLRHTWLWERFQWRTVDRNVLGGAEPADVAIYSNVLSQPMYGPFIGCGYEKYLGHGFSLSLDLSSALYLNFVREIVRYERGDEAVGSKRANREYTIAPELEAHLNLWWYPIEGIQIRVGYDAIGILNTMHSPNPVDFYFPAPAPRFEHRTVRFLDGWNIGIGFIF